VRTKRRIRHQSKEIGVFLQKNIDCSLWFGVSNQQNFILIPDGPGGTRLAVLTEASLATLVSLSQG